jgi:hypothetical protein
MMMCGLKYIYSKTLLIWDWLVQHTLHIEAFDVPDF